MERKIEIRKIGIKVRAKKPQFKSRGEFAGLLIITFFIAFLFLMVEPNRSFKLEAFNLKEFVFSNIPTHPSLKQTAERNFLINGAKMKIVDYQAENTSIPQIIEYYKKILLERDYNIGRESQGAGYFLINFADKDLKNITIAAYEGKLFQKPKYVFVKITSMEEGVSKIRDYLSNQDIDMPGSDIAGLKRYPNARRVSSSTEENGIANVSYSLDNQNCLQCVVSFYKEEMAKSGWILENESYQTKEESKQDFSLDINSLKEQFKNAHLPAEQKEKLEEAIGQLESIAEKSKESETDMAAENTTLNFKKAEERCTISLAYREFKQGQGQIPAEQLKGMETYLQSVPAAVGDKLRRVLGLNLKEAITITILYMPSLKNLGGQKAWF